MKKFLKILSKVLLVISILIVSIIVLINLFNIIKILFFGITVGGDYPDSIWWGRTVLKGFEGVKKYYSAIGWELLKYFEIPISIICIIYQIIYFKVIKKGENNE